MEKTITPGITFRANEKAIQIIDKVKREYHLKSKTDAIHYIIDAYANQTSNCNPYYRGLLAKYSMDMEDALNYAASTGDVYKARKVQEDLLCQMLL